MIVNNNGNILISNKATDEEAPRSNVEAIRGARSNLLKQNEDLNKSILRINNNQDQYGITDSLEKNLKRLNDAIENNIKSQDEQTKQYALNAKALLQEIDAKKEVDKLTKLYMDSATKLADVNRDGAASSEKLFQIIEGFDTIEDAAPALAEVFNEIETNLNDFGDKVQENTKLMYRNNKMLEEENRAARKERQNKYKETAKTAGENLNKEIAKEWSKVGSTLRSIINTINIDRIAQTFAPNARQKLQADIQTNYSISKKEFQSFKQGLFKQVDNQTYSSEEIMTAMQTLSSTALTNTETATKNFRDLVRGQKLLGMSSQTQEALLKLGNVTGRNELHFYTTQVAKYLNSDLGLNKRQLDELVSLNTTLQTQAADIGIATEEFKAMSTNETAAFEATNAGFGAKYNQSLSRVIANTEMASAMLGMSGSDVAAAVGRGESYIDILKNGMGSRAALEVLRNGTAKEQADYYEFAKEAWGVDENTWSLLRLIAQQETELNKNLKTATDASKQGDEALEKTEKQYGESLTIFQKVANGLDNWWNGDQDWEMLNYVDNINKTVELIAVLLGAQDIVGGLNSIFGSGSGGGGFLTKLLGKGGAAGGSTGALGTALSKIGVVGKGGTALSGGTAALSAGRI